MGINNLQSSCFISDGERRTRHSKFTMIRDWPLIMEGGGGTNWENGRSETFSVPLYIGGKIHLSYPLHIINDQSLKCPGATT